ncbi:MAG TPA: GntR family transcriptional regulator [Anaerolineales bacterium]|nr:GntR family transcriptional regulator [Anaerolineales bacterium]
MASLTHSLNPTLATTKESIADSLRAEILRGNLKSGQALKQDEIAAQFGISKIPVREALIQLKAEGLINFYPNRGAFVSELSAAEADEIYVMRIALETAVLARAIPNLTVAQLKHAEEILDAIDQEENIAKWGELNWEFHATLYASASLPRLMDTIKALHTNIARYLVLYLAGMAYQKKSQKEHRAILAACRHGDIEKALTVLEVHLRGASEHLVAYLNKQESS